MGSALAVMCSMTAESPALTLLSFTAVIVTVWGVFHPTAAANTMVSGVTTMRELGDAIIVMVVSWVGRLCSTTVYVVDRPAAASVTLAVALEKTTPATSLSTTLTTSCGSSMAI